MDILTGLDALLITQPLNIYYLTGFAGLAPDEREGYALVTKDATYLFTNPLYREKAAELVRSGQIATRLPASTELQRGEPARQVRSKKIEFVEISRENPLANSIKKVLAALPLARTIKLGFEENNLTVAELRTLEKELHNFSLIPTRDRVEELRKFKQPHEVESIKKACALTDDCFTFILKKLSPGVTESEIAWEIESYFKKQGAENSFPPIVAFGQNASQPHYASSANCELHAADLVLLDFGAKVNGYCADMTRMAFVGEPKKEWETAYIALKTAQQLALNILKTNFDVSKHRSNLSGAYLDRAVRDELKKFGYPPYPHSLGHAVGLAIHETPRLSVKRDEELKPGMVFSVEPGIYLPDEFGMRIEDLVLLTQNGIEILSKSTKEIIQL